MTEFDWLEQEERLPARRGSRREDEITKEDLDKNGIEYYQTGQDLIDKSKEEVQSKELDELCRLEAAALRQLPRRHRLVVQLAAEGLRPAEIAKKLGYRSGASVTSALSKPVAIRAFNLRSERLARVCTLGSRPSTLSGVSRVFDLALEEEPVLDKDGNVVGEKIRSLAAANKSAELAMKYHNVIHQEDTGEYQGPQGPSFTIQVINKIPGKDDTVIDVTPRAVVNLPEPE